MLFGWIYFHVLCLFVQVYYGDIWMNAVTVRSNEVGMIHFPIILCMDDESRSHNYMMLLSNVELPLFYELSICFSLIYFLFSLRYIAWNLCPMLSYLILNTSTILWSLYMIILISRYLQFLGVVVIYLWFT